jgi:hypothetical protein
MATLREQQAAVILDGQIAAPDEPRHGERPPRLTLSAENHPDDLPSSLIVPAGDTTPHP